MSTTTVTHKGRHNYSPTIQTATTTAPDGSVTSQRVALIPSSYAGPAYVEALGNADPAFSALSCISLEDNWRVQQAFNPDLTLENCTQRLENATKLSGTFWISDKKILGGPERGMIMKVPRGRPSGTCFVPVFHSVSCTPYLF